MRKPDFCICKNKEADQLRGNHEADQRLCFHYIEIVQSLYFIYTKFQASSHLLWLCSPVCVGPDQKHRRPVFSRGSHFSISVFLYDISESAGCSKLTMSLANVSLKFKTLIVQIHCYCLLAHLSRRLVGELIVYPCSGVRPSVRRPQFQT